MENNEIKDIISVDKTIHEPARAAVMAILYTVEKSDFLFVMNQLGLTQGNLSSHLAKLEKAEYIIVEKQFVGKRPKTFLSISEKGKEAFGMYLEKMKVFLGLFG